MGLVKVDVSTASDRVGFVKRRFLTVSDMTIVVFLLLVAH